MPLANLTQFLQGAIPDRRLRLAAVLAVAFGAVILIVLGGRRLRGFEALPEASKNVLDLVQKGSPETLMSYVTDDEKRAANLDETTISTVVKDYWRPAFARSTVGQADLKMPSRGNGSYLEIRFFTRPDGLTTTFSADVMLTPNGVICPGLLHNIVYSALIHRNMRPGEDERVSFARGIRNDRVQLEQMGITGLYNIRTNKMQSWGELQRNLDAWAKAKGTAVPAVLSN